jgi:hypothetical protein
MRPPSGVLEGSALYSHEVITFQCHGMHESIQRAFELCKMNPWYSRGGRRHQQVAGSLICQSLLDAIISSSSTPSVTH